MTPKELLIAAKAKIADPAHWIQGQLAGTLNGFTRAVWDEDATCFCMLGALMRVEADHGALDSYIGNEASKALDRFSPGEDGHYIGFVNYQDSHTHAEVMAVFDKAIESLP